jgi:FG-GAP repeat
VPGVVELGDHFGAALAAGDFDRNGFADLAVGSRDGDTTGLTGSGVPLWSIAIHGPADPLG